jgi:hypothetical protein
MGVKRSGRDFDHPSSSETKVTRKRGAIPLLPLWEFMTGYRVKIIFTLCGFL